MTLHWASGMSPGYIPRREEIQICGCPLHPGDSAGLSRRVASGLCDPDPSVMVPAAAWWVRPHPRALALASAPACRMVEISPHPTHPEMSVSSPLTPALCSCPLLDPQAHPRETEDAKAPGGHTALPAAVPRQQVWVPGGAGSLLAWGRCWVRSPWVVPPEPPLTGQEAADSPKPPVSACGINLSGGSPEWPSISPNKGAPCWLQAEGGSGTPPFWGPQPPSGALPLGRLFPHSPSHT